MKTIGLTGGIASGKSLVVKWFRENQVEVLDSDAIYKKLLKTNKILYNKIVEYFGEKYSLEDGRLNTSLLGEYVFSNPSELEKLNEITHPFVLADIEEQIIEKQKSNCDLLILDIPLLFEAKLEYICDEIICVYIDYETQLERLLERDNDSVEMAIKKINSQMSLEEKAKLSDYVIDNSKTIENTRIQFKQILDILRSEANVF